MALCSGSPVPGPPTDPSPYRPSSRRFPDPVHLRIEDVPEFAYVADRDRVRALLERAERLRADVLDKGALIDRDAVWELKREALELVVRVPLGPGRQAACRRRWPVQTHQGRHAIVRWRRDAAVNKAAD